MPKDRRPPARLPTRAPTPPPPRAPTVAWDCEVEIIAGLESVAQAEIRDGLGDRVTWAPGGRPDTLRFTYRGDLGALRSLRSVVAVYLVRAFAVPRPRGLLDYQHFATLLGLIATARGLYPAGAFRTLRLSAAGEDSAVLARLKTDLATRTGLQATSEEGDLLLRLRRPPLPGPGPAGWEALVRLSPRPLTARAWRVCNWPGALNAVVAHSMLALAGTNPADRYLNFACGSGTLLIERLALGPARLATGVDWSPAALRCARANLGAAGQEGVVRLVQADAGRLPFPAGGFDRLAADLPFGQIIGSHDENTRLYPRLLAEATRVAAPGARLVLVTHEVHLLERLLAGPPFAGAWTPLEVRRVTLPFGAGGLNPRVYLLQRVTGRE